MVNQNIVLGGICLSVLYCMVGSVFLHPVLLELMENRTNHRCHRCVLGKERIFVVDMTWTPDSEEDLGSCYRLQTIRDWGMEEWESIDGRFACDVATCDSRAVMDRGVVSTFKCALDHSLSTYLAKLPELEAWRPRLFITILFYNL
jgi:hypothetical protein